MCISISKRKAVFSRDGNKCAKCGSESDLSIDHVIPKSKGCPDCLPNLQTLCRTCNQEKASDVFLYTARKKSKRFVDHYLLTGIFL